VLRGVLVTSVRIGPATLDLTIYRGDEASLTLTITEDGEPAVLPETGWKAQVRARRTTAANAADFPVLMEFSIDASDAADGVLILSWDGDDIDALPKKAYWDLQNDDPAVLTRLGGVLIPEDQVTR
jgi:hypothetical protein